LSANQLPLKVKVPELPFSTLDKLLQNMQYEESRYFSLDFGFQRLNEFDFRRYDETRSRLDLDSTSKLSPYIRFGVICYEQYLRRLKRLPEKTANLLKNWLGENFGII